MTASPPFAPPAPCCNLCGGVAFAPGPGGRMSVSGQAPRCLGCGSLERHRATARVLQELPQSCIDGRHALLVGAEQAVAPARFREYFQVDAPVAGSFHIPDEARKRGTFDFIGLIYVLEFLNDDRHDFERLMRLLAPEGLLQVSFICPGERPWTSIQSGPRGSVRRLYGRDVAAHFGRGNMDFHATMLEQADPVTGAGQQVHFFQHHRHGIAGPAPAPTRDDHGH